jgi:hypothetical protein
MSICRGMATNGRTFCAMTTAVDAPAPTMAPWQRTLVWINALLACAAVLMSFVLTATGIYPSDNTEPTQLGNPDQGAIGRILDYFTYFTIWSNIIVAIVVTMLAIRPSRDSFIFRVVRLDALLMITVTGIIYNAILAASAKLQGFEVVTNFFDHLLVPAVTVVVWLLVGPRGWINWRIIGASLVIPIVWLVWALARGAVIGAYPYGFLNVAKFGYGTVLINVLGIVVFAIVLCLIFWGIDSLIRRATRANSH